MGRVSQEEFIKRAKKVHGDKYDYSKSIYAHSETKVIIICPTHGEFLQTPHGHNKGKGCAECAKIGRRFSKEEFIKRANKIHGDKYDYSKSNYVHGRTKIIITCPIHGEFEQIAHSHIEGRGCKKCGKTKNTEWFIHESKKVHGDKYDYTKAIYVGSGKKLKIVCAVHGEFEQIPHGHLGGKGCRKCGFIERDKKKKKDTNWFIEQSKKAHGETYHYSNSNYTKALNKITIICKIHGEFEQTAMSHMKGFGCDKCGNERIREALSSSVEEFRDRANKIHNYKYDYSLVEYKGKDILVKIKCPDHGVFLLAPNNHIKKNNPQGCQECSRELMSKKMSFGTEEYVRLAKEVHKDYDYSLVEYVNAKTPIKIICPEHGPFMQNPDNHLRKAIGCPVCQATSGEKQVRQVLEDYNIEYVFQKWWDDCRNINPLPFDFYLPDYNAVIEYHGKQHYEPIALFRGKKGFEMTQKHDKIKKDYCLSNGIGYIEISYEVEDIEEFLFNELSGSASTRKD